jgi:hypothetical protein
MMKDELEVGDMVKSLYERGFTLGIVLRITLDPSYSDEVADVYWFSYRGKPAPGGRHTTDNLRKLA